MSVLQSTLCIQLPTLLGILRTQLNNRQRIIVRNFPPCTAPPATANPSAMLAFPAGLAAVGRVRPPGGPSGTSPIGSAAAAATAPAPDLNAAAAAAVDARAARAAGRTVWRAGRAAAEHGTGDHVHAPDRRRRQQRQPGAVDAGQLPAAATRCSGAGRAAVGSGRPWHAAADLAALAAWRQRRQRLQQPTARRARGRRRRWQRRRHALHEPRVFRAAAAATAEGPRPARAGVHGFAAQAEWAVVQCSAAREARCGPGRRVAAGTPARSRLRAQRGLFSADTDAGHGWRHVG
eukprot:364289-Chlamydomonas_euryale.AAC.15